MLKYGMQDVHFLKIDIEGAEGALLAAAAQPEVWLPHVTCRSIEIHEREWAGLPTGWKKETFVPLMARHGFERQLKGLEMELQVWCQAKYAGERFSDSSGSDGSSTRGKQQGRTKRKGTRPL